MTVSRNQLVEYWPLVDIGKLDLKPGDVVVFRSDWLCEDSSHRFQFFQRWRVAFPLVTCVAISRSDEPDFVIQRAMPEMRAEDLVQPERKGTME
jgi:hypothetical protein